MSQNDKLDELVWSEEMIPRIFTPVNCTEAIASRRLLMIVWYADEILKEQVVVGQANILMNQFEQTSQNEFVMDINMLDLTCANSVVGNLTMKVHFELLTSQPY